MVTIKSADNHDLIEIKTYNIAFFSILIISNDINNLVASTITILPITSNITRIYPFEVLLQPSDSGLPKPSKVQAQQIRTISKRRLEPNVLGKVKKDVMKDIEAALRLHLALFD
jgi:mRNA interferase MazF